MMRSSVVALGDLLEAVTVWFRATLQHGGMLIILVNWTAAVQATIVVTDYTCSDHNRRLYCCCLTPKNHKHVTMLTFQACTSQLM